MGTAVLQVYHSHARFHIPQAPCFFGLEETDKEAIVNAISSAATRTNGSVSIYQNRAPDDQLVKWEYGTETGLGDYLQTYRGQTVIDFNYALSKWGRNGWELISIASHKDRLIGFFKRPISSQ